MIEDLGEDLVLVDRGLCVRIEVVLMVEVGVRLGSLEAGFVVVEGILGRDLVEDSFLYC